MSELKLPAKRGNFVEFRSGIINVCPVGRSCSQAEREAVSKDLITNKFVALVLIYFIKFVKVKTLMH